MKLILIIIKIKLQILKQNMNMKLTALRIIVLIHERGKLSFSSNGKEIPNQPILGKDLPCLAKMPPRRLKAILLISFPLSLEL